MGLLALVAAGCGDDTYELLIDAKTDLVPGIEFARVRVEVFTRLPRAEESAPASRAREHVAARSDAFADGTRVAELAGLAAGEYAVRVRLLDQGGVPVLQRIALVTLKKTSVFTIVLTRDCRGVICPLAGDDPSHVACLGGRCVDPRCTEETLEACGEAMCTDATQCATGASCAEARCDHQTCLLVAQSAMCAAEEWCDPLAGCTPLPGSGGDGGMDGGSIDAGDDAATDGGVADATVDAGPPPMPTATAYGTGEGYAITVDAAGNRYVGGYFEGTASFDGATSLTATSASDGFVAAYAPDGSLRWARAFPFGIVLDIAIDAGGNVYATGWYEMTTTFGGASFNATGRDIFVVSWSPTGVHRWSAAAGGTGWDLGQEVAVDAAGDVYVGGSFTSRMAFAMPALNATGPGDGFLASFTNTGAHRWSRALGGGGDDEVSGVGPAPGGGVVVGGAFAATADFGGGPLASAGGDDVFVARFASDGTHVWSVRDGGAGREQFWSFDVDATGSSYVAGDFGGTTMFGGMSFTSPRADGFVVSYGPDGAFRWVKTFPCATASDAAFVGDVAVDPFGTVHAALSVFGSVDSGAGFVMSAGEEDIALVRLNADGSFRTVQMWGSTSWDYAWAIAAGPDGSSYLTGMIDGTVDFGGGPVGTAGTYSSFLLVVPP